MMSCAFPHRIIKYYNHYMEKEDIVFCERNLNKSLKVDALDVLYDRKRNDRKGFFGFNGYDDFIDAWTVSCGKCPDCTKAKRREWVTRLHVENVYQRSLGNDCFFITLTYENNPVSLSKRDFQLFRKRFRMDLSRNFSCEKIRFFACGEYGGRFGRPHYHLITWLPFRKVDVETIVKSSWKNGLIEVDLVDGDAPLAYVSGYCSKKLDEHLTKDEWQKIGIEPEFILQSRKPGIGFWLDKEKLVDDKKIYLSDGKMATIPSYYFRSVKFGFTDKEKEVLKKYEHLKMRDRQEIADGRKLASSSVCRDVDFRKDKKRYERI